MKQEIVRQLKTKARYNTLGLLQFACDNLSPDLFHYNEFQLLSAQWNDNDTNRLCGILKAEEDQRQKNQIRLGLFHLIDQLNDTALRVLHAFNQFAPPEYKILCLSYNEDDRKKMETLFAQYPELKVDAEVSNDLPKDLTKYPLLLFDNFTMGNISHPDEAPNLAKKQLSLMKEWLEERRLNGVKKVYPGFIIHYGKRCYLVEEYSEYCAAANFPFTLYGLIKQIIFFWESQNIQAGEPEDVNGPDG